MDGATLRVIVLVVTAVIFGLIGLWYGYSRGSTDKPTTARAA